MATMRRTLAAIAVLISGMACNPLSSAQTLTIRLLNAKSGKPMQNKNVTLTWCPDCSARSEVFIGKDGTGHVVVPPGTNTLSMTVGPKIGNEPYRIAFIRCNEPAGAPIPARIPVAEVLEKGMVPQNTCGHKSVAPKPGEIVFWGLPKPWWQPDFQ
jgi:hypothetical protein